MNIPACVSSHNYIPIAGENTLLKKKKTLTAVIKHSPLPTDSCCSPWCIVLFVFLTTNTQESDTISLSIKYQSVADKNSRGRCILT